MEENELNERLKPILKLMRSDDPVERRQASEALDELHPADIAEMLGSIPDEEQPLFFALLENEKAALVLQELEYGDQARLLEKVGPQKAALLLGEMAFDDIADLIGELKPEEASELLNLIEDQDAKDVESLLAHPADTAGGLMTTEFIALPETLTAGQAIEQLRRIAPDAELIYYIYVTDARGRLVGVLSLRELIVADPSTPLSAIMTTNVIMARIDEDQEEVARTVAKYDLLAVPVVDRDSVLVGIVTVDDIIDVIEEEATEDFYRMQGAHVPEDGLEEVSALKRSLSRLPWLIVLLFGGLLSGSVIKGFGETLESVAVLAYFIPVLAGTAGNIGTQSLAVVVRGLATGDLSGSQFWRIVLRESQVGLMVGMACGVILSGIAFVWQGLWVVAVIVGMALILNMIVATIFGSLIPLIFSRLGFDPAIASGPFITTFLDMAGLFNYFWLATFMINRFYL